MEAYKETEHTVKKFVPKYLLEGENVNILPTELKTKTSDEDLRRDRKLALKNTIRSHDYNRKRFDLNRRANIKRSR